jgi:glycoprotein 2-beta-D-xylosyltransferase
MVAGRRLRRLIPCALIILALAVYLLPILLQYSYRPSPDTSKPQAQTHARGRAQKPWPRLPSFFPWTVNPALPPRSCEAYFGNGFSRRVDVLLPKDSAAGGWFRCHHSETLGSSICEGARVRLDPARVAMSRGGEPLALVRGRAEYMELPRYEPGALEVEGAAAGPLVEPTFLDAYVPAGVIRAHTMRALLGSARVVPPGQLRCSQVRRAVA